MGAGSRLYGNGFDSWGRAAGVQKEKQPVKWNEAQKERRVAHDSSKSTKSPEDDGKEVEKETATDKDSETKKRQTESASQKPQNISADSQNHVENQLPDKERDLETTKKPEGISKPETTKKPGETREPETTKKPEGTRTLETTQKPEGTRTPETTQKPEGTRTPETTKKPEGTRKPESTKTPSLLVSVKDYTKLCSMECVSPKSDDTDEITMIFSSLIERNVLNNQIITSYDQLHTIIQKIENERNSWNGDIINQIVQVLEQYDRDYFQRNVLYYHNVYWTAGYDFRLSSVNMLMEEGGRKFLKIELDKFWALPPDYCAVDVMCYYGCFIQIPRDVAEECDAIECSLIGGFE